MLHPKGIRIFDVNFSSSSGEPRALFASDNMDIFCSIRIPGCLMKVDETRILVVEKSPGSLFPNTITLLVLDFDDDYHHHISIAKTSSLTICYESGVHISCGICHGIITATASGGCRAAFLVSDHESHEHVHVINVTADNELQLVCKIACQAPATAIALHLTYIAFGVNPDTIYASYSNLALMAFVKMCVSSGTIESFLSDRINDFRRVFGRMFQDIDDAIDLGRNFQWATSRERRRIYFRPDLALKLLSTRSKQCGDRLDVRVKHWTPDVTSTTTGDYHYFGRDMIQVRPYAHVFAALNVRHTHLGNTSVDICLITHRSEIISDLRLAWMSNCIRVSISI